MNANGTLQLSSGFTVDHPSAGSYTLHFPPGTFNFDATNFPVLTGAAYNGGVHELGWTVATLWGDGHFDINVTTGASDGLFDFHLLQHNGPNNPGTAPAGQSLTVHSH